MVASFSTLLTMAMTINVRHAMSVGQGGPALDGDFPDPTIVQDVDGSWYAFATEHAGIHVQAARAPEPEGPWTRVEADLLPKSSSFFTGGNTWAPDVRVLGKNSYVLYYSGQVASDGSHHCVGVATSTSILGPYAPRDEPLQCDLRGGGEIDPSSFRDDDGNVYVTYKVDGNSIGAGGECNNGIDPKKATPIMLQQVATNGIDKMGDPRPILDRVGDEPLVEAPAIYRARDGTYILFFSAGCYTSPSYNVNYATAKSIGGPYTRASSPLITSNDGLGLVSPGGATPVQGGDVIVFHANCRAGRCMHVKKFEFKDGKVALL